ncbi:3'(2'),5'-bisphosphate nucleotidase [Lewinellaceae bacterium SD302]|nr:3'(2'),5'-bisphosphate nucleotidase [Lewinellaceae bacterium SD302]
MTDRLELAKQVGIIARDAGAAILRIYENEDFGVEHKADDSPLTKADKAANDVIVAGLEALDFQAPIVSEELKEVSYAERKQYTRFWLVDPLDGTKEFIKRNGDFTVNIALIENGGPVLGVVYIPVTDQLYYAATGAGAWEEGAAEPIEAAQYSMQDNGLKVVASRSHLSPETEAFMQQLNDPEIVSRGSSLKLIELAKGTAHLYPRLAPTMEWDIGAAQIILEEAGGKVIDQETGVRLAYNKQVLRNNHFIAYGRVND